MRLFIGLIILAILAVLMIPVGIGLGILLCGAMIGAKLKATETGRFAIFSGRIDL